MTVEIVSGGGGGGGGGGGSECVHECQLTTIVERSQLVPADRLVVSIIHECSERERKCRRELPFHDDREIPRASVQVCSMYKPRNTYWLVEFT